jgi:signal transduction histidine kinase
VGGKDADFLMEDMPEAVDETLEGANRVTEIVRAMKEFAHPGSQSKSAVDVNRVIETSSQVSRNEWKYIAELVLDLDKTIPMVQGYAGPLGQSLLIMFVNSAQAMAEHRSAGDPTKGTIRVTTRHEDGVVEIRVADNGPGIPNSIIDRIFDPFFTTKEVGKGSGQGLSIARSGVVDKHRGEIGRRWQPRCGVCDAASRRWTTGLRELTRQVEPRLPSQGRRHRSEREITVP